MSVWVVCPSIRPVEHVREWAAKWKERGYRVAIFRDPSVPDYEALKEVCDIQLCGRYPGYAKSVNELVAEVLNENTDAEWFVIAGDDIYPDANFTAEEIAAQCRAYFEAVGMETQATRCVQGKLPSMLRSALSTFGCMQPTGDRWADRQGPMSERVAGSAWCGREFCKRVNRGTGPLWNEYFHYCVDEELQEVATRMGVFWQRPDIIHLHNHYMRSGDAVVRVEVPAHLEAANKDFMNARRKFATRKANGFPGSECL